MLVLLWDFGHEVLRCRPERSDDLPGKGRRVGPTRDPLWDGSALVHAGRPLDPARPAPIVGSRSPCLATRRGVGVTSHWQAVPGLRFRLVVTLGWFGRLCCRPCLGVTGMALLVVSPARPTSIGSTGCGRQPPPRWPSGPRSAPVGRWIARRGAERSCWRRRCSAWPRSAAGTRPLALILIGRRLSRPAGWWMSVAIDCICIAPGPGRRRCCWRRCRAGSRRCGGGRSRQWRGTPGCVPTIVRVTAGATRSTIRRMARRSRQTLARCWIGPARPGPTCLSGIPLVAFTRGFRRAAARPCRRIGAAGCHPPGRLFAESSE